MSVLISVVTAVYNDEKYIRKSVESILQQTYNTFEFIIVDDGSNDNTLSIIREIAKSDNRIIILTQQNAGAAAARNLAINSATGKYIAIQDSDDISSPERLQKQLNQLLKSDGNLISCTGYFVINPNDDVIAANNKIYRDITSNMLKGSFGTYHPSMMLPRQLIINEGGYNTFYNKTEDYDLVLRLLEKKAHVEKLDECLISYRIRGNSESSMNSGAHKNRAFENHLKRIQNEPEDFTPVVNKYKRDKNYVLKREVREVFYSENYSKFLKLYFKNLLKLPIKNYFPFFLYAISPLPLKKLIKSVANYKQT